MALSYLESGNNTASGSWDVSYPNASAGDLLIFNIGWDDSTTTSGLTPPSGPNGETAVVIEDVRVSSNTAVRGKIVYYKATGTWTASTLTFTPSASEQWSAVVVHVPAGEFDSTTPIGADNYFESAGTDSTPDLPSLTAGASDGGGTVVGFMVGDADDADGTITGWTSRASTDRGAVGVDLWTRNTVATDSESIAAATGATYPSARDYVSFIYIIRPNQRPTVALNSPADASSDSDTTPILDFTGTDTDGDSVRYEVQVSTDSDFDIVDEYYFDASDAGPTDPDAAWASDANAADGSTSTSATSSTQGSTSSNFLLIEGTNAPSSGNTITQVRARIYGGTTTNQTLEATFYTDGLGESLGTATWNNGNGGSWDDYSSLSTPSGGWTWAKLQALEVKAYGSNAGVAGRFVFKIEIEVTSGILLDKVSGGVETTETLTSSQAWVAPVGVNSVQVESWGGGGAGAGRTTGDQGSGGGGGAYSKTNSISVTPGQSYAIVIGSGGAGVTGSAGGAGGDTYFDDGSENLAKGGSGASSGTGASGGSSGSCVGDTKYSGGNGANSQSLEGGGGGGGAGSTGAGGSTSTSSGGTGTSLSGGNGGAGASSGDGSPGSNYGGGGGGCRAIVSNQKGGNGAGGLMKITYTPGDTGFANPDNGGDTDPFNSGENIQFTVQAGDALSADTYYWRVRGIDPTGSNTWGDWSSTRSFEVTAGGGTAVKDIIGMGMIPFAR